jgi:hypothetical protein
MNKTVGVVIGRFQLPRLHAGHQALINHVLSQSDVTCILVGVAQKITLKNLLPYPAIESMIRGDYSASYGAGKLRIHPLLDVDGNDLQWSAEIDRFLSLLFPGDNITLWSGRDSFKPSYLGKYRPVKDWYGFDGNTNGSEVRNKIIEGNAYDNEAFRAGIIYGVGNYLRSKETPDVSS